MSHFADNYGETQAYRAGLGNEESDPKDFCEETGCENCDGELGACTHKCHEMQAAREEIAAKTFKWFAHEVAIQRLA